MCTHMNLFCCDKDREVSLKKIKSFAANGSLSQTPDKEIIFSRSGDTHPRSPEMNLYEVAYRKNAMLDSITEKSEEDESTPGVSKVHEKHERRPLGTKQSVSYNTFMTRPSSFDGIIRLEIPALDFMPFKKRNVESDAMSAKPLSSAGSPGSNNPGGRKHDLKKQPASHARGGKHHKVQEKTKTSSRWNVTLDTSSRRYVLLGWCVSSVTCTDMRLVSVVHGHMSLRKQAER